MAWRRIALLLLLACALLFRLPAGFMPGASARGVSIGWCNAVNPQAMAEGQALLDKALAERPAPKHRSSNDQPCPFAAAAQPMAAADPLPQFTAPARVTFLPPPVPEAFPGRGLVAPPPFATGPPLHA